LGSGQFYKDASGNVGIGTDSTPVRLSLVDSATLGWSQSATETIPAIFRQTASAATVVANGYRHTATANGFASGFSSSFAKSAISLNEGTVRFYTDTAATTAAGTDVTPTERARIDSSGNVNINTTSNPVYGSTSARLNILKNTGQYSINSTTPAVGNEGHITFRNPNGIVGEINTNGSSTSYVTSSDYRLKHDIQPMTGALAKVAALKPVTYKWNADDSQSQGFIAHELQEVVPECVTGEKDAVDAEGNPQYQGIDTSFLVATLTAAIQEQQAIITALTTRVEALEAA
jgi:hypothetical protein